MHAHIVSVSLVLVVRRISLCPCSSEFVSSGSSAAIEVVFPGMFRNCRIHDHFQVLFAIFPECFQFPCLPDHCEKVYQPASIAELRLVNDPPNAVFPFAENSPTCSTIPLASNAGVWTLLDFFLSIFLADHVYPFGGCCIQEGELGETRSRPRQLLVTIIVPEVVDLLFKTFFCRNCPPDEVNKFQRDWERAFLCSAHGVLPFVEHDDDE